MSDAKANTQVVEVWKARLQRFYAGSVTVTESCATEGFSVPSFYQWQRRIKSLEPSFVPPDRRRRKHPGANQPPEQALSALKTRKMGLIPVSTTTTANHRIGAFQPIQLPTPRPAAALASIQLPSGVIVELQDDPNLICQVLERFLPLALQAGDPSC